MEQKTDFKSIDRAIYELPEIRKRLRPVWWAWICVAIGVMGFLLNRTLTNIGAGTSSLVAGLIVIGVFGAATIVAYFIFGDCRAPYCKTVHRLLSREFFFYSANERAELFKCFENKDMHGIEQVKKSASPKFTLVRYSDNDEKVFYAQIFEAHGNKDVPVTEIVKMENK